MSSPTLAPGIAKSLIKGVELRVRHLAHPPTPCDPLFSPPPGEEPESTHFQSHFFIASIRHREDKEDSIDNGRELLVFAAEVLVYTTARLTTVFVSKADSSGFLYLLDLPPKSGSIIRNLSIEFLSYLVRAHQRPGVRLVLSLFGRAQAWYLFRGSPENPQKHVLDDRGLIKWWCRVFDPILRTFEPEDKRQSRDGQSDSGAIQGAEVEKKPGEKTKASATAYLIVPGCEKPEMRSLYPPSFRSDDNERYPRWMNSYPLHQLSAFPSAPPRCLIPRFPDDPKTRFLIDLDDSIPEGSETSEWRSVKTLDQFWETMAFRQECSAGRIVGFLWMVVNPPGVLNSDDMGIDDVPSSSKHKCGSEERQEISGNSAAPAKQKEGNQQETEKTHEGQGETSLECNDQKSVDHLPLAIGHTSHQPPPPGVDAKTILLSHEDYTTVTDALGDFDFPDKETSVASTASWLAKLTSILNGNSNHGELIVGQHEPVEGESVSQSPSSTTTQTTNVLKIRKRKKRDEPEEAVAETVTEASTESPTSEANGSPVTAFATADTYSALASAQGNTPTVIVNVLSEQLVRKKKKLNGSAN